MSGVQGPAMSAQAAEAHRDQLARASGPALLDQCERFTTARYACSMAATTNDELRACAEAPATN